MSVVVVTGGGNGIGAAVAEELGRQGHYLVTMDPLVTLDGSSQEQAAPPEDTTAGRIVAAGGAARASAVSVTDSDGVRALFKELATEFGRLDAVVNVAGISRPTNFASGSEADWRAVLEVHLDGYRNVLNAALPLMAAAGYGRILGVTSGGGWRAMDAGAYGDAKRAVASLTWELGRHAPPGVVVNAMSPIAVTRMVTAAMQRAGRPASSSAASAAGPLFGSMPEPGDLGPIGAHLVGDSFGWCRGQVIFTAGAEVAVVEQPRLLEVVRSDSVQPIARVVAVATPKALLASEAKQLSGGGSNPRFGSVFAESLDDDDEATPVAVGSVVIFASRPEVAGSTAAALETRGVLCDVVEIPEGPVCFEDASDTLVAAMNRTGPVDGVVVALSGPLSAARESTEWGRVLAEHDTIVDDLHSDAAWARAVADYSGELNRPV
ncbi:MAG: SDR family oxidoreductase, partial [Actinobacteria bacterium]|nr:SDR family oxidoreductase [Actinomycetota bacterium]